MVWLPVIYILFTVLIGIIHFKKSSDSIKKNINFANDFLAMLSEYFKSKGDDIASYEWLIKNSTLMKSGFETLRNTTHLRSAFSGGVISKYEVVITTLPELRQAIERNSGIAYQNYLKIKDTVLLNIDGLKSDDNHLHKELTNPLNWFYTGTAQILIFPFRLLQWTGLLSSQLISNLQNSNIFRYICVSLSFTGFIAAIIFIIKNWDKIVLSLMNIFVILF